MVGRRFATTSLVVVGTSVVALALAIAVIGGPRSGSTAASLAPPASVVGATAEPLRRCFTSSHGDRVEFVGRAGTSISDARD